MSLPGSLADAPSPSRSHKGPRARWWSRLFDPTLPESLRQLVRYRLLIWTLVSRDMKARYRGSVLGFLWSFLNPLMLMAVYTLVFSVYLRMDEAAIQGPYAIFLFCGLLPWTWHAASILEGSMSIVANGGLVNKALFPAEVLPLVTLLSNLIHFLLGLPILFIFLYTFGRPLTAAAWFLPLLIGIQFFFTMGVTMALATVSVTFRDLQHLLANLLTLWFFATPIIYPSSMIPPQYRFTVVLNPMVPLMESYQDVLFRQRPPQHPIELALVAVLALLVAAWGYSVLLRKRDDFPEEV